jgi:restriction system protein
MTTIIDKVTKEDLFLPVLRAIDELGGSGRNEEINNHVIEAVGFTPDDMVVTYDSGAVMVPHKIAWARSYLREAGLLKSEGGGVWVLTDAGRDLMSAGDAAIRERVKEAKREYNKRYQQKKASEKAAKVAQVDSGDFGEDEGNWADLLLAKVQTIDPYAFERLSQLLLRKNGFTSVEVTGKTGDGGIDGKGVVRVNLVSFHVLFQCKRYQGSVSAGTVRDFRGAMQGRADKGLIITTGTFTPDARREATRDGAPAIDLIDGQALCLLLKDNRLGVTVEMVEQVTLVPEFFDEI